MQRCGFEIIDAIPINTHGGSTKDYLSIRGKYTISSSVEELIKKEEKNSWVRLLSYLPKFSENIYDVGEKLKKVLKK